MSSDISATIQAICDKGYQQYSQHNYSTALRLFYQAWLKLPKPQNQHPFAEVVLCGIGDTYYQMEKYDNAVEALRSALACIETEKRSFVLFRLGQSLLNSERELQAKTYLHKSYRLSGDALFRNEDPRYIKAISELI